MTAEKELSQHGAEAKTRVVEETQRDEAEAALSSPESVHQHLTSV